MDDILGRAKVSIRNLRKGSVREMCECKLLARPMDLSCGKGRQLRAGVNQGMPQTISFADTIFSNGVSSGRRGAF